MTRPAQTSTPQPAPAAPARILVTDAHAPAALTAVRALGRAGHRVTLACSRRHGRPPAAWSRWCAGLRISPNPRRSRDAYCQWLEQQVSCGEFDAVLPLSEASAAALSALSIPQPAAPVSDIHSAFRIPHSEWSDPGPTVARALAVGLGMAQKIKGLIMNPYEQYQARRRAAGIYASHAALLARGCPPPSRGLLFVCYGNICRSPFAEAYWNRLRARPDGPPLPPADSAGFYHDVGRCTPSWFQDLAADHGADLAAHRSRVLTQRDVDEAGMILVMDAANARDLLSRFPEADEKLAYLGPFAPQGPAEIADPFLAEDDAAVACYATIAAALEGLADWLAK